MNFNKIKASYYETGTKVFNFTRNPYFRPLMMATLLVLPFVLAGCKEGAQQIVAATATPHLDPTATALPPYLSGVQCSITDFHQLGADAQGVNFPHAIPEGGLLTLDCGGNTVDANLHYATLGEDQSGAFYTTAYTMGPDGDQLTRMGEIGTNLRAVQRDMTDCQIGAFPAPVGNGTAEFTTKVDISAGDHFVVPITTVGNSESILASEQNGGVTSFDIHPEYLAGAGGDTYTQGHLQWALFQRVETALNQWTLNFRGIFHPNEQCPAFIDELDQ